MEENVEVQECEQDRPGIGQLSFELILTDYIIHKMYKDRNGTVGMKLCSPEAKIKATKDVISVYNMKTELWNRKVSIQCDESSNFQ